MCKTIQQKVIFKTSPAQIYKILADSSVRSKVTGRKALIGKKAGDRFTADGGLVHGVNVDLKAGVRLVQAWRNKKFPEGVYSMAAITLRPTKSGTELTLTHRGVPKHLIPEVEQAWRDTYWSRIKSYLAQRSGI